MMALVGLLMLLSVWPVTGVSATADTATTDTTGDSTTPDTTGDTSGGSETTANNEAPADTTDRGDQDGAFSPTTVSEATPPPADSEQSTTTELGAVTDPPLGTARSDQIQILGIEESEGEIVLDVAVPPAIGENALGPSDFGVSDSGRLVDIMVEPVSTESDTVVVLDTSGSMRGSALDAAKAAAARFIEALPEDTRVGLISFDETVEIHQTPTLDRAAVLADLAALAATGNETAIWDALLQAGEVAGQGGSANSSIVVLSDGDDTASGVSPAALVAGLNDGDSALYAVAIESPDTNLVALEGIVAEVGGQFLSTDDVGQLEQLYTEIAGRLANRYRIRFAPQASEERTIIVSVSTSTGVATARAVVGHGGPAPTVPEAEPNTGQGPVLNIEDQPVLGVVSPPALGWLGNPVMQWIGFASIFAALCAAGWALTARPNTGVRLDAAAGADQIGGINTRLGHMAERLITQHDRRRRLDGMLEAADISMRPGEFVIGWLVATGVLMLAVSALVSLTAGVLIVPVVALAAFVVLNSRAAKRQAQFADQLTETLSIMASSLRSGQSLPKAIELVAAEAPTPTAEQFHRISFEVRVGRDLTDSIRDAATRMDNADLEWLAEAVDIHRELGGDLTEIMDNVAATIRERRTVARQIKALSAEGRATGWVLLAMPVLLFFITWWRTPRAVEVMIGEGLGRVLLGLALAGMVLGHLWIRKLVKFKY